MKRSIALLTLILMVCIVRAQQITPNIFDNGVNVGIGTNTPQQRLDVNGFVKAGGYSIVNIPGNDNGIKSVNGSKTFDMIATYDGFDPYGIYIGGYNYGSGSGPNSAKRVYIGNQFNGANYLCVDFEHNAVGIGTTSMGTNKLAVEGTIAARKVIVTAQVPFPDYVFDPGYGLLPLDSLSRFVRANHHLPDVPSADSVAKNGLDLGGNQAQLLKKIEELTLYVIDQNRTIKDLQAELAELKATIKNK